MTSRPPKRVLFANPWWHEDIVNGTVRHAAEHGWHLDLQTCLSGIIPEQWEGDGLITMFGGDLEALQRLIRTTGCPAVSLNANHPEIEMPRVSQDDTTAGKIAADHFLERGFRHYAYYSHGMALHTSRKRSKSFQKTLSAHGHTVEQFFWGDARKGRPDTWHQRQIWLRRALKHLPKPLALFATNDQGAVEVIEACLAESISVPDEVAVLGMLNMAIFRNSTSIPLSSITVDFDTITRIACDLLARMMDGEPPPCEPIDFPATGVAVRRSTDTIAARTPEVARAVRYMLDHYGEPIEIANIVRDSGMGKTALYGVFNDDLGESPGAVLTRIRLDKAKHMLLSSDAKVYAISDACGFGDVVNLHRHFKQHTGTSPSAYRKAKRVPPPPL